jgi:hypothetical protein
VIVLAGLVAVKVALAVMLVVAGITKLADLAEFQASLWLLLPRWLRRAPAPPFAVGIAGVEIVVGGLSLTRPGWEVPDLAVLALCAVFVLVSAAGSLRHRGRRCRCFGALADHRFGPWSIVRSVLLLGASGIVAGGHDRLAGAATPDPVQTALVLLALVPTVAAFAVAAQVLRSIRASTQEVRADR